MINLRRMGLPKAAPHPYISEIYPIQKKMMDFYKENPRCAIMTPRRTGKSMFVAMQAVLSKFNNTLIVSPNKSMADMMTTQVVNVCKSNKIMYTVDRVNGLSVITIGGYHIQSVSYHDATHAMIPNFDEIMVDEYNMMHMDLNLKDCKNVILIGGVTDDSFEVNVHRIGTFAGLNINGD